MCLDEEARGYAFEILTELRAYGYRCDMDMMARSFKGQFKTVDRTHAKLALLIGSTELNDQVVTVKNIAKKTQQTVSKNELITYVDSLLDYEGEE